MVVLRATHGIRTNELLFFGVLRCVGTGVGVGGEKNLYNLKMPRLPSALGLGGAKRTGGLDWTLNPPMRSDSPNPPSPPPPQASSPCTLGSYAATD
eukprot:scaffold6910_cov136-Isochrysis_galbana.AAC.13